MIAVKIAGNHAEAHLDSRFSIRKKETPFSSVDAPDDIREKCRDYMKRSGIVFGAFDFLIDTGGRWVFLECNEAGQFLFLEQRLPELPILDKFCRWLASFGEQVHFTGAEKVLLSTQAFESSDDGAQLLVLQTRHKHTDKNDIFVREHAL
ncbi:hypothetical protein NDN01_14020 [Sphingomonas sp. QA11]|uniref:hypothetical protein n=1 Tax=Sphingomonas sp. QA11 TaxID=2950605 RepID=UPI00234BB774|nr:hypothetical protein [Sphingomonas sp. QA11]WCM25189.1 hypothetical protein NDN01_14020 [Sphingomonas sp. QA11]